MTEIIKIKDGIIIEHSFVNRELREGEIEVKDFNGNVGDNVNLYDENWNIITVGTKAVKVVDIDEDDEEIEEVKTEVKTEAKDELKEPEPVPYTRTDELMTMLYEIDLASVRAIRAILSGTDTEEDHKTLEALEKQAVALRKELNAADTVTTNK